MRRLLIFLVLLVLIEFVLPWALAHYGLIVLGASSWWMWSLWQGHRRA
jgi:hypothetical protein